MVLCMNEKFRFVCEATCSSGDGLGYKWFMCERNAIITYAINYVVHIRCLVDLSDCGPYYCEVKVECYSNLKVCPSWTSEQD